MAKQEARSVKGMTLKVSENRRYLTDQDGKPFFYLADTAWRLFKALNHEEIDEYFLNRIAKGFTVIQAYLLRGLNVQNIYGQTPLIGRDPTRPNEAFYENIDYAVNRANELGLVMGGVVCWGGHVQKNYADEQIFTVENAFLHGKFLGSRYKDNCVIWYLGGDTDPLDNTGVWASLARGLKTGSDGKHLVSYHGPGMAGVPSSSNWFHNEDWLDFNVLQTGHGWTVNNYDFIAHDRALSPTKPVLDMEASYENHPDGRNNTGRRMDARQIRESMYWQMLAGAAGHGYGCNDIWCFYDETWFSGWKDYAFPSYLKQNMHWKAAMDLPGATCMGIARRLLEQYPWYELAPDLTLIAEGQGEGEKHVQSAVGRNGRFALAYLPFGTPVGIRLDRLTGPEVRAQWFNPRDGRFIPIGTYGNAGVQTFTPPTCFERDDWVLVLDC